MPGVLDIDETLRRVAALPPPQVPAPATSPMEFDVEETLARIGRLPPAPEPPRTNALPTEFSVEDTLAKLDTLPPASAPQMLPGTAAYTNGTRPVAPKAQVFRQPPAQEDIIGPGQAAAVAALTETPPTLAALKVGGMVGQRMPGPPAVKLAAGLVAGLGTGFAASKAGRAVMPESWRETLTAIEQEHPTATLLGGMAAQALALRPSVGTMRQAAQGLRLLPRAIAQRGGAQLTPAQAEAVFNVAFGSGTAAAMEGIRQFREGNFRPAQLAAAVVAGAAMHKGWGPFGKLVGMTPKEAKQFARVATEATMTTEERLTQRGEEIVRGRAAVQEEFAQRFDAELADFMHQARQAEIQRRAGEPPPAEAPAAAEPLPVAERPLPAAEAPVAEAPVAKSPETMTPEDMVTRPTDSEPIYQSVWDESFRRGVSGARYEVDAKGRTGDVASQGYRAGQSARARSTPGLSLHAPEDVQRNGITAVVYRGTSVKTGTPEAERFIQGRSGAGQYGIYVTPRLHYAQHFEKGIEGGALSVQEVSLKHPLVVVPDRYENRNKAYDRQLQFLGIDPSKQPEANKILQRKGYDGIVVYNQYEDHIPYEMVVFDKASLRPAAVDAYGIKLPPGYVRSGDRYVFKGEAAPPVPPATPPNRLRELFKGEQPAAEPLPPRPPTMAEPPPAEPPPPPEPPMEPLFPTAPEGERPLYQTMERAPEELGYKGQEEAIAAEPAFRRERQSLGEIKERLKVEAPAYVDFVEAVERNAPVAELATKAEGLAPLSSAAQMLRFHREIYQSSSRGAAALLLKDFKSVVREGRFKGTSEAKTAVEQMIEAVGRTQDEGARRQLIDEAVRLAQPNIKWKLGDLFDSYRYFNMLTNPISHLRNVYGNTFNLYVAKPLELAATGHPVEAVRFMRDASRASADAWRNAIKAWSEFSDSKYADVLDEAGKPFEVAGRQNIPARAILSLPTRALQTVDAVFSTMFKQAETTRLLRRGVSQATAEGMADRGAKNLFYMENLGGAVEDKSTLWAIRALDGMGKKFQEWGKDPNVGPVARMVFAFMRVSTNMAKANLQWSPFAQGITGRTMRTSVIADAIAKRDYGRPFMGAPKAARAAIMEEAGLVREQRVGRAMAGWMASAIGTIFAANGMTTGFPHDEKERQALYASGRLPGSVYIPGVNRWVPFYYFGPFMFSMAIPALAADEIRRAPIEDVSDAVDTFARVMKDGARIMGQMSTMTGAANVMKALAGEDDWSVQRAFGYLAGQFNPGSGAQRAVANWMDQRARKPKADWSNFWQQLITDIPGLSQYVGAYKTPTGEEAVRAPSGRYLPYAVGRPDEDYEALYQNRIAEMFQQAAKRKALGPKEERPKQVRQRR